MKVAMVSVIVCASSSTVPTRPARIVVTSKLHASAVMLSAPEMASFQNGLRTSYVIFRLEIRGQVSLNRLLRRRNKYDVMITNSASRVNEVAHGAPSTPNPAANIRLQLKSTSEVSIVSVQKRS